MREGNQTQQTANTRAALDGFSSFVSDLKKEHIPFKEAYLNPQTGLGFVVLNDNLVKIWQNGKISDGRLIQRSEEKGVFQLQQSNGKNIIVLYKNRDMKGDIYSVYLPLEEKWPKFLRLSTETLSIPIEGKKIEGLQYEQFQSSLKKVYEGPVPKKPDTIEQRINRDAVKVPRVK